MINPLQTLYQFCPELAELRDRIRSLLADSGRSGNLWK